MKHRLSLLVAAILAFGSTAVVADEYVIELSGFEFQYNGQSNMDIDLTIRPGDTVRWVWVSGRHNVVSGFPGDPDEGVEFNSGDPSFPPMEFSHTFTNDGLFGYHCQVHEGLGMISQIKVVCPADFNADFEVNTIDVLEFLNAWTSMDPSADFNGDGDINTIDVLAFLNAWTAGC